MGLSARILQKVVRNEAMASDPPEIYGWRVYLLACSVSCSSIHTYLHDTSIRDRYHHDEMFDGLNC